MWVPGLPLTPCVVKSCPLSGMPSPPCEMSGCRTVPVSRVPDEAMLIDTDTWRAGRWSRQRRGPECISGLQPCLDLPSSFCRWKTEARGGGGWGAEVGGRACLALPGHWVPPHAILPRALLLLQLGLGLHPLGLGPDPSAQSPLEVCRVALAPSLAPAEDLEAPEYYIKLPGAERPKKG